MTDLKHEDRLLFSQDHLIRAIDPNISTSITQKGKKKFLVLANIPCTNESMAALPFLTNTDMNNNYLHLDSIKVFLNNSPYSSTIYGLNSVVVDNFRKADSTAFSASPTISKFLPFSTGTYSSGFKSFLVNYSGVVPNSPVITNETSITVTLVLSCD